MGELPMGEALPIGVLSLNPAVDMTYEIPRLLEDQKAHAVATRFDPGGNGINVGRALKRLNTPAQSYCVAGGEIGQLLQRLLRDQLDWVDCEEVAGETRINGTFIDAGHILGSASIHLELEEDGQRRSLLFSGDLGSAHADQAELLAWHGKTGNPPRTILIHGEKDAMAHFAALLDDTRVEMPANGEQIAL